MNEIKYCKDCKHFKLSIIDYIYCGYFLSKCKMSVKTKNSLIYKEKKDYNYCSDVRGSDLCGKEAKLFESKK